MNKEIKENHFFNKLKAKREAKNLSVNDVVEGIKINKKYIEAIENGNFNLLPKTYARLFIKSYAKFIGADQNKTLEQYQNFITGLSGLKNKTPAFINKKTNLNNAFYDNREHLKQKYYFLTKKILLSLIALTVIISLYFIIDVSFFQNKNIPDLSNWNYEKLNWKKDFENLAVIDSQYIKLNNKKLNNTLIYKTFKFPDKIIITDNEGKNISNRILNKNESDTNSFNENINFAILYGSGNLEINSELIKFKYKDNKIVGSLQKDASDLILNLNYCK